MFGNKEPQIPVEHRWQLVSKSYAPPRNDVSSIVNLNLPPETLEKLLCGVTTYYWECQNTGKVRKEELLGSDVDQLEDLAERVEVSGNLEHFQVNNKWYAIGKMPNPNAPQIPVK